VPPIQTRDECEPSMDCVRCAVVDGTTAVCVDTQGEAARLAQAGADKLARTSVWWWCVRKI
jgi:hypothetical protein